MKLELSFADYRRLQASKLSTSVKVDDTYFARDNSQEVFRIVGYLIDRPRCLGMLRLMSLILTVSLVGATAADVVSSGIAVQKTWFQNTRSQR